MRERLLHDTQNLRSAQLSVEDAENTLENYTITAPISGTIIQKNVQAGETVGSESAATSTSPMCIIHDLRYLEMTLNVDELQILSMKEGQDVRITAAAKSTSSDGRVNLRRCGSSVAESTLKAAVSNRRSSAVRVAACLAMKATRAAARASTGS